VTTKEKTDPIQISNDLNTIEDQNDVKFDFSELLTVKADGVLAYCNGRDMCLIYYQHVNSYTTDNKSYKEREINKCIIEIQMTPEQLKIVSGVIQAAIKTYQSRTRLTNDNSDDEKNPNTSMFI
jgi:hypothetical protein